MADSNFFIQGFELPILEGRFLRRYKRFFADIELPDGSTITAHCPNTGSMLGLKEEGARALVSVSDNPKRKLAHTLECLESKVSRKPAWVCVNTARANKLVEKLLHEQKLGFPKKMTEVRREVTLSESPSPKNKSKTRLDFCLNTPGKTEGEFFIEVKSVTLSEFAGEASFPDAVTERGLKHIESLEGLMAKGFKSALIFLIVRGDCQSFSAAEKIDPAYAEALKRARKKGLKVITPVIKITKKGFYLVPGPAKIGH